MIVGMADPSLKGRVAELIAVRDQTEADAERVTSAVERFGPAMMSDSLRRFALAARRKLRNEDGSYRRGHLRALVQRIEVVDPTGIRILGTRTELLRTVVAAAGVRSLITKWRPKRMKLGTGVRSFASRNGNSEYLLDVLHIAQCVWPRRRHYRADLVTFNLTEGLALDIL